MPGTAKEMLDVIGSRRADIDEVQPSEAVGRRDFIRRTLLCALGLPAASALLAGCDSGNTANGLLAAFAAVVAQQQSTVNTISNAAVSTTAPSQAQIGTWLAQCNQSGATVQTAARAASQGELRAAVPDAMRNVLDNLDEIGAPLDPSGAAPQYTQAQLLAAVGRANVLLQSHAQADRRALWALCVGLCIVQSTATDATILAMAQSARDMDTQDTGGAVYDLVFAGVTAAGVGHGPATFEPMLASLLVLSVLLLLVIACQASRSPYLFFDNMLGLVILFALMFYMVGYGV